MKRPHIIILNPDEMRFDAMGHMGNRAAHTPNLDSLAVHEAVSFDHAYCQNPVCVPSRCSFLTGLYPHTTGHRTMSYLMHENESTLFSELKDAGYYVWLNSRNDFLAGQVNDLEKKHADEVYYYRSTSEEQKASHAAAQQRKPETAGPKVYNHFLGITDGGSAASDWHDTNAAIDRIHRINELNGQPLCLFLGWVNPHPPYAVSQEYYDLIDDNKIVDPIQLKDTDGKSRMVHKLHEFANLDQMSPDDWREIRHIYLAQCAFVDDMVGRIIDALKEEGIYDDCAIFFLSDHGDYAGDYNLPEKAQSSFEDSITRVPFLIKPPKVRDDEGHELYPVDPGLASSPVELVDFYATAMHYAGVEPDHDQFGMDLQEMVSDRSADVRSYAHCEGGRNAGEWQCDEWHDKNGNGPSPNNDYYAKKCAQKDDAAHEKATMITDGRWKFIYRSSGASELYDLSEDPYELHNIYGQDPSGIERKLEKELLKWYQTTCDVVPKKHDIRFTEDKLWGILQNHVPAELEIPVREYIRKEKPDLTEAIVYVMGLGRSNKK